MTDDRYHRLVDALVTDRLQVSLADWITARLDEGVTWRQIPDRLEADTDGLVVVTRQSLRKWHPSHPAEATTVDAA